MVAPSLNHSSCRFSAGVGFGPSQLRRGKSITTSHRAGFQAGIEPALALLGGPVRKGIRNDIALRLALERVVADRGRGTQGRLQVPGLYECWLVLAPEIFVLVVRPNAGEAIRLQLTCTWMWFALALLPALRCWDTIATLGTICVEIAALFPLALSRDRASSP